MLVCFKIPSLVSGGRAIFEGAAQLLLLLFRRGGRGKATRRGCRVKNGSLLMAFSAVLLPPTTVLLSFAALLNQVSALSMRPPTDAGMSYTPHPHLVPLREHRSRL